MFGALWALTLHCSYVGYLYDPGVLHWAIGGFDWGLLDIKRVVRQALLGVVLSLTLEVRRFGSSTLAEAQNFEGTDWPCMAPLDLVARDGNDNGPNGRVFLGFIRFSHTSDLDLKKRASSEAARSLNWHGGDNETDSTAKREATGTDLEPHVHRAAWDILTDFGGHWV